MVDSMPEAFQADQTFMELLDQLASACRALSCLLQTDIVMGTKLEYFFDMEQVIDSGANLRRNTPKAKLGATLLAFQPHEELLVSWQKFGSSWKEQGDRAHTIVCFRNGRG